MLHALSALLFALSISPGPAESSHTEIAALASPMTTAPSSGWPSSGWRMQEPDHPATDADKKPAVAAPAAGSTPQDAGTGSAQQPVAKAGSSKTETPNGSPVPEPGTLLLVGTGLVGFALTSRRLRRPASRS